MGSGISCEFAIFVSGGFAGTIVEPFCDGVHEFGTIVTRAIAEDPTFRIGDVCPMLTQIEGAELQSPVQACMGIR